MEEHFYLLLAVLFPLFARRRGSCARSSPSWSRVLVGSLALRLTGVARGVGDVRLQWRTHFRMDALAAGVLLAVLRVHAPRAFDRLVRRRWLVGGRSPPPASASSRTSSKSAPWAAPSGTRSPT